MSFKDPALQKEYLKNYHLKTWNLRKSRHKELKIERRKILSSWLKTYKTGLSCIRCGEVGNLVSKGCSIKSIKQEIDKCIVLCANCHRKEHGV